MLIRVRVVLPVDILVVKTVEASGFVVAGTVDDAHIAVTSQTTKAIFNCERVPETLQPLQVARLRALRDDNRSRPTVARNTTFCERLE